MSSYLRDHIPKPSACFLRQDLPSSRLAMSAIEMELHIAGVCSFGYLFGPSLDSLESISATLQSTEPG